MKVILLVLVMVVLNVYYLFLRMFIGRDMDFSLVFELFLVWIIESWVCLFVLVSRWIW